jgi:hypothetical protein
MTRYFEIREVTPSSDNSGGALCCVLIILGLIFA